jgi:3-deoxy-7-phosphoheptulonate synthase
MSVSGAGLRRSGFTLIAGPCAVESREQTLATAECVAAAGATMLRGGAFRPSAGPRSFQGLGRAGLGLLREARARTGLPVVTELTHVRELDAVLEVADLVQVGARNMHNHTLLTELGRAGRPVLLKRGAASTVEDLLLAADYLVDAGNRDVILCERGIRTFETAYRNTLDLGAVAVLKERTTLPVIVDPSHAAGRRELVRPLSLAAIGAGADGLIVEVHPRPAEAECDGPQALTTEEFPGYAAEVLALARVLRSDAPKAQRPANGHLASPRWPRRVMLFKRETLARIRSGEVTLAFRRWRRPNVKAGGTLRTPLGVLAIDSVERIEEDALTEADARRAGAADRAALMSALRGDGALYRIALHFAGPDPRIALRERVELSAAERSAVDARLSRFDAASRHGPWTFAVLRLIAERPGVRAPDLAAGRGLETARFKADVRKLKELGLTESLQVGYRLSPRGRAYLGAHGGPE